MPYLIRRDEENTSVAEQTNRELELIKAERKRRKIIYKLIVFIISINIKFILFTSILFVLTTYCYFGFFALINYFNSKPLHISF